MGKFFPMFERLERNGHICKKRNEMERAPKISNKEKVKALGELINATSETKSLVAEINERYEYWDTVKYKNTSALNVSATKLWQLVAADRMRHDVIVWPKYSIHFAMTNKMQQACHDFDVNLAGRGEEMWGDDALLNDRQRERYMASSLMEEAISSSQMEGASTTRKVAKEMLRNKTKPRDKSQQMIHNNYQTICFISEHKNEDLTPALFLKIHSLMTQDTLDKESDAGRLRTDDSVVVEDGITHEIVHRPPSYKEIEPFVEELCQFFNAREAEEFVHPVIRGIVVHFMVAYMHPFVDGNGRTARALFYWYMLRNGYWMTEYLSISRIIYAAKKSYEKAYLYSEADGNDIGYFITYNLNVLKRAHEELKTYIKRKQEDRATLTQIIASGGLNERQAEIIRMFKKTPGLMLTVKDVQGIFGVTPTTAKADIAPLVKKGYVKETYVNKVKRVYTKGDDFREW